MQQKFSQKKLRNVLDHHAKTYYDIGESTSKSDLSHNIGLDRLKNYISASRNILESGSGAGAIMSLVWNNKSQFTGIDISEYAIKKARRDFKDKKNARFIVGKAEKLPFEDSTFDLVYSGYVIEHVLDPEKMIDEMIRVVKKNGKIILIAPNYGSPIEFSPSFLLKGFMPVFHSVKLFLLSHLYLLYKPKKLNWNHVRPIILDINNYYSDSDTTVEPYIQTLLSYLERRGMAILEYSSGFGWSKNKSFIPIKRISSFQHFLSIAKRIVVKLGKKGIAPYKYFGPTLFVVGGKR